ncbi:DUF167 domain-containing protein [Candidatus Berkelbacteria bacterium]|nr:DUF167 domain-containing protein [Candidatus Berkelbacteria bacterium]
MLRIKILVKPVKRTTGVTDTVDGTVIVSVTAHAERGKANAAVIQILSQHFGVAPSAIRILRGHTTHHKVVEIS